MNCTTCFQHVCIHVECLTFWFIDSGDCHTNASPGGGWVETHMRVWRLSKKGKKTKKNCTKKTPKNPARAGWLKRLWLIQATPWADFVDIRVQLCSTIIEIFKCVALSYKDCFHSVLDNCGLLTTPKETLWFEFRCSYFENFVIWNLNIDFWYQRIVQSWFASIPSSTYTTPKQIQFWQYTYDQKFWTCPICQLFVLTQGPQYHPEKTGPYYWQ